MRKKERIRRGLACALAGVLLVSSVAPDATAKTSPVSLKKSTITLKITGGVVLPKRNMEAARLS